jgi:hypothetical protein
VRQEGRNAGEEKASDEETVMDEGIYFIGATPYLVRLPYGWIGT